MIDARTDPMAPDTVGDSSTDGEIRGEQEYLKTDEGGPTPPPGSLDYADPATAPTEDPNSDPGLVHSSRDPSLPGSMEDDGRPEDSRGDTPYDAQGTMGSEGGAG